MSSAVFRHILVPTDGSEPSVRAAQLATHLLRGSPGRLTVLYVVDELVLRELTRFNGRSHVDAKIELEEHGRRYLKLIERDAEREGLCVETLIRQGTPFEEIVAVAAELGVDLIAMGHIGQRGARRILIGSVTGHVLDFATCPVLVVKGS